MSIIYPCNRSQNRRNSVSSKCLTGLNFLACISVRPIIISLGIPCWDFTGPSPSSPPWARPHCWPSPPPPSSCSPARPLCWPRFYPPFCLGNRRCRRTWKIKYCFCFIILYICGPKVQFTRLNITTTILIITIVTNSSPCK